MALDKRLRTILIGVAQVLPVVFFLLLAFFALRRGSQSVWHEKESHFLAQSGWQEMESLAQNLIAIGKPDSETLFWGMFASIQLDHPDETNRFAELLSRQRALNWRMEMEATKYYKPASLVSRLLFLRSRIVFLLMGLMAVVQGVSCLKKRTYFSFTTALALLGSVILLA